MSRLIAAAILPATVKRVAGNTADVLIVGGGAAGLMCAIVAGRRGRRVTLIEHNAQIGRKILISGGGRCNFTNLNTRPDNFLSANPHFAKSALARYTPRDFLDLVERYHIPWHEKTAGQLFCDRAARDIVGLLLAEWERAGVRIETACSVHEVHSGFAVETSRGVMEAAVLVVASGGLSIPKIGATPAGYRIARQFSLNIEPCRPALVPLTFSRDDLQRFHGLAGVATSSRVCAGGHSFEERLLFTHRGLSGPAVLQASSYWNPGEEVAIDLAPGVDFGAQLRELRAAGSRGEVRTVAGRVLPKRLADRWFDLWGPTRSAA